MQVGSLGDVVFEVSLAGRVVTPTDFTHERKAKRSYVRRRCTGSSTARGCSGSPPARWVDADRACMPTKRTAWAALMFSSFCRVVQVICSLL